MLFRSLDFFLVPFKNAPNEIWDFITDEVKSVKCEEGIPEFCDLISLYYRSNDNDAVVDALLSFIQKYPNYKSPNEMLGYTYYNMSMWNNAIACFEKVEKEYYFFMSDIYWMLAWSSSVNSVAYLNAYFPDSSFLTTPSIVQ